MTTTNENNTETTMNDVANNGTRFGMTAKQTSWCERHNVQVESDLILRGLRFLVPLTETLTATVAKRGSYTEGTRWQVNFGGAVSRHPNACEALKAALRYRKGA